MASEIVTLEYMDLPVFILAVYLQKGVKEEHIESIRACLDENPNKHPREYMVWRKGRTVVDTWKFHRPDESWLVQEIPLQEFASYF